MNHLTLRVDFNMASFNFLFGIKGAPSSSWIVRIATNRNI